MVFTILKRIWIVLRSGRESEYTEFPLSVGETSIFCLLILSNINGKFNLTVMVGEQLNSFRRS